MSFSKKDIYNVLDTITAPGEGKSLVENECIKNVVFFDKEVIIDLETSNPTLQSKKKLQTEITKALQSKLGSDLDIKVNIKVEVKNNPKTIKSQTISNINNIIAIASGKGGVGKSTVTSNIAISLAKMGFSVGILDADIYGPSQHIMFNVEHDKPLSVKVDGKSKMKPVENYGVKLLSIGFFTDPNQAVIWRGPMASKALNQLIFDADWGKLDFLLIDLPPGTGDIHLSMVQAVPINGAIVVSTPQNIALADAKKGIAMFEQETINIPVLGIIENMAYFTPEELPDNKYYIFGKSGARHLAEDTGATFLGEIPIVQGIREASDVGHPAALQKNSQISSSFEDITKKMLTQLINRNKNLPPTEVVKITTMSGCSPK